MRRLAHLRFVRRTLPTSIAGLALAACAAQQCDPDKTDLFSGLGCSVGSGYQQRSADLQQQLQQNDAQADAARARAAAEAQNAREAQSTLAERRAELRILDSRTAQLRAKLEAARKAHSFSAAQYQQARSALLAVQAVRATTPTSAPDAKSLATIKQNQTKLNDLLSTL